MNKVSHILVTFSALISLPVIADSKHQDLEKTTILEMNMSDMDMDSMNMSDMDMNSMDMSDMDMNSMDMSTINSMPESDNHMAGHAHSSWEAPPKHYENIQFDKWTDYQTAYEGMTIYQNQCMSCHGIDGQGTGPIAGSLEHPPADLTNHFHKSQGMGDAYLFWRISEGGSVEPFKSSKSMMPSFKNVLSDEQRWQVLTYVHQVFHGGFNEYMPMNDGMDHSSMGH